MQAFLISQRNAFWLAALVVILLGGVEIFFSLQSLPIPQGDALYFYPSSLYFRETGDLINPIINVNREIRLVWHGWLHAVLYAYLAPIEGLRGILVVEDWIAIVISLLFTLSLIRVGVVQLLPLTLLSIGIMALFIGNNGRPETLAAGALLFWFYLRPYVLSHRFMRVFLDGVALGVLATFNPYCSLVTALLLYLILIYDNRESPATAVSEVLAISAICGLSIFLLCETLYSFNAFDWLQGLYENSKIIAQWRSREGSFVYYYFFNPTYPILGGWLLAPVVCTLALFHYLREEKLYICLYLPIALFLIWFTFLRVPERSYYLVAFTPLALVLSFSYIFQLKPSWKKPVLILVGSLSLCLCSGLGFRFGKNYLSFQHGLSFQEASVELHRLFDDEGLDNIVLDPQLSFVLLDGKRDMTYFYDFASQKFFQKPNRSGSKWIVFAQAGSGYTSPPKIPNYSLSEDRFFTEANSLLGLKIFNTPNAYNYAVYQQLSDK